MRYTNGTDILTFSDIRALYPNTSFPSTGPSEPWLNGRGLYSLVEAPAPIVDWDEITYQDGVEEISGEWRLKWSVREMTEQEIDDHHKMIRDEIATHRDTLIEIQITTNLDDHGDIVLVNNDRTKTALASKKNTMSNETDISNMAFKAENGWFDLTYSDYQNLEVSLDVFTQSIFDIERIILGKHDVAPYNTVQDAIDDFNSHLES